MVAWGFLEFLVEPVAPREGQFGGDFNGQAAPYCLDNRERVQSLVRNIESG
jgi:hypothetical protein